MEGNAQNSITVSDWETALTINKRWTHGETSRKFIVSVVGIKIYKTIILPVVLYGCEKLFLTLREECRLRVFEKRMRDEYLGPRGMRMESGEGSTMRNFIILYRSPNVVWVIKSKRLAW